MPLAQAHARRLRSALPLGGILLACAAPGDPASGGSGVAASAGYEGVNFYESEADRPPMVDSLPLGVTPGAYGFVNADEELPVCSVGVSQRARAEASAGALACPPVRRETISDFTSGGQDNVTFDPDAALPGGTYHYPDGPDALRSDVSGADWHVYGTVSQISGFGIYLSGCRLVDAAAYRGIAFTLWGELGEGGALMFFVGTAENQVASSWINENESGADEPDGFGRCIPLARRYDGTCREARRAITVPPTLEQTVVLWRDLSDGCPEPSVNPGEITSIAWYFPQPVRGSYTVDIHIDDLRFSDEAPL